MPEGPFGFPRLTTLGPLVPTERIQDIVENKLSQIAIPIDSTYFESRGEYVTDFMLEYGPQRQFPSTVHYEKDGDLIQTIVRLPIIDSSKKEDIDRVKDIIEQSDPIEPWEVRTAVRESFQAPHIIMKPEDKDVDDFTLWLDRFLRLYRNEFDEEELISKYEAK